MICQYYFGLFCFHGIVAVVRGGILCQRRSPWMSDFHSVCLSHLDVQLVNIFSWQAVGVESTEKIWITWTLLFHTLSTESPPSTTSADTTARDPVVKPFFLNLRDSRAPSALCHTESNPSWATEIPRLLSQMRPHVFHWSFVFLILLRFRLSCRTLRRVQALKCD